jgi:hypothetical protein
MEKQDLFEKVLGGLRPVKFYSSARINCSYYGNPRFRLSFSDIATGNFVAGKTASDGQPSYSVDNVCERIYSREKNTSQGEVAYFAWHETRAGNVIIDKVESPEEVARSLVIAGLCGGRDNYVTLKKGNAGSPLIFLYRFHPDGEKEKWNTGTVELRTNSSNPYTITPAGEGISQDKADELFGIKKTPARRSLDFSRKEETAISVGR